MNTVKTLYLVDDDEDWRFLVKEAIIEVGLPVKVIEAENGQAFFEILQQEVNNAILLIDVNMPVMNGIETLEALKNSSYWSSFSIFLVSSSNSIDLVLTAKEVGAVKFITKPTYFNEYIGLIKELYTYQ